MRRILIYYKPEYIDVAAKLQENYIAHQKEADIISEEKQDDIEYARGKQYDEAVFIEDPDTVIIHEVKSGYTNRCPVADAIEELTAAAAGVIGVNDEDAAANFLIMNTEEKEART